ncbi:hypothetical protein AAY473_006859 [Plecturocebus cupreus]
MWPKIKSTSQDHPKGLCHAWSLALLSRLECSGVISAHCHLRLSHSRNSSVSASKVARTTGSHHHTC